jgi:hypothetical protein
MSSPEQLGDVDQNKEDGKFYYRKDNILFGPYDTYKEIHL